MKQVIIRIKDVRGRTIHKEYFLSNSSYQSNASEYVQDRLLPGMEVTISAGRYIYTGFTYEDCLNDVNDYPEDYESVDDVIRHNLTNSQLSIDIRSYLPQY